MSPPPRLPVHLRRRGAWPLRRAPALRANAAASACAPVFTPSRNVGPSHARGRVAVASRVVALSHAVPAEARALLAGCKRVEQPRVDVLSYHTTAPPLVNPGAGRRAARRRAGMSDAHSAAPSRPSRSNRQPSTAAKTAATAQRSNQPPQQPQQNAPALLPGPDLHARLFRDSADERLGARHRGRGHTSRRGSRSGAHVVH